MEVAEGTDGGKFRKMALEVFEEGGGFLGKRGGRVKVAGRGGNKGGRVRRDDLRWRPWIGRGEGRTKCGGLGALFCFP